jgi:hypothetical protein
VVLFAVAFAVAVAVAVAVAGFMSSTFYDLSVVRK